MNNLSQSEYNENLNELISRYLVKGAAWTAYQNIHYSKPFRYHNLRTRDRSFNKRRGYRGSNLVIYPSRTKELLDFYSVLQIAYLAGFIGHTFSKDFTNRVIITLNTSYIKVHRLERYQSLLPTHLVTRLENGDNTTVESDDQSFFLFYQFLDIKALLEEDDEIQYFLTKVCNDSSGAFELLLSNDQVNSMNENPYLIKADTTAMNGYLRYIDFIEQFFLLLTAARDKPELEAAFANYFITGFYRPKGRLQNILDRTVMLSEQLRSSKDDLLFGGFGSIARYLAYIDQQMQTYTTSGIFA
jgi:hypothetical protein